MFKNFVDSICASDIGLKLPEFGFYVPISTIVSKLVMNTLNYWNITAIFPKILRAQVTFQFSCVYSTIWMLTYTWEKNQGTQHPFLSRDENNLLQCSIARTLQIVTAKLQLYYDKKVVLWILLWQAIGGILKFAVPLLLKSHIFYYWLS